MGLTKAEEQAKNFFIKLICDGTFHSCHDMLNTEIPEWYNEQKFSDGQNFCKKNRFVLLDSLATGVIAVFSDIRSLQILNSTGRSSTAESARKRYASTTLHILNWYTNELKAGSSALNSLDAVRKAHVVNSKASVLKGFGEIKQFELVLTGFGFFGFHLLRSDLTGIRFETEEDKENFIHLWAVFTRMIGVKDEFNICLLPINVLEILGRMLIRYILIPNIQLEYPIFKTMVRAIAEGLGEFSSMFTYESQLFYAKMLIGLPGYQYYLNYDNEILSKTELLNDDEINKLNQALKTHMDKEFNPITKNIPIYEDDSTALHGKRIQKYVNYENEWKSILGHEHFYNCTFAVKNIIRFKMFAHYACQFSVGRIILEYLANIGITKFEKFIDENKKQN